MVGYYESRRPVVAAGQLIGLLKEEGLKDDMKVELRDVTAANYGDIIALELKDGQKHLVAPNVYSLAQANYEEGMIPRAIYGDGFPVGFMMYISLYFEDTPNKYSIFRFMVDRRYQSKGVGRSALKKCIDEISLLAGSDAIQLSFPPSNLVARSLYESCGFIDTGNIDEEGEVIMELSI